MPGKPEKGWSQPNLGCKRRCGGTATHQSLLAAVIRRRMPDVAPWLPLKSFVAQPDCWKTVLSCGQVVGTACCSSSAVSCLKLGLRQRNHNSIEQIEARSVAWWSSLSVLTLLVPLLLQQLSAL